MLRYDILESLRLSNQWIGASTKAFWGQPAFALHPSPIPSLIAAWGKVTERSWSKVAATPDWGIDNVEHRGRSHVINRRVVLDRPFCRVVQFTADGRKSAARRVLIIAPMSGHYATLVRNTVTSLLPDCDVHVTEWKNARDVPVSAGSFDVEDYAKYIIDFMAELGPDLHVIAVCQPVPLALVATARMAELDQEAAPRSLTLIGGPVDPEANPTDVTNFGSRFSVDQLDSVVVQTVGLGFDGAGRRVYPGTVQLASFMSMNWKAHVQAFAGQVERVARNQDGERDRHNSFYDEYLAVMDMPAEFYLSTVERIFRNREIARNEFSIDGEKIDISGISSTAIMTIEGGRDDISAPGQCRAALDLVPELPDSMKESIVEPDAGHYGIFSGRAWRTRIKPQVMAFMDRHSQ